MFRWYPSGDRSSATQLPRPPVYQLHISKPYTPKPTRYRLRRHRAERGRFSTLLSSGSQEKYHSLTVPFCIPEVYAGPLRYPATSWIHNSTHPRNEPNPHRYRQSRHRRGNIAGPRLSNSKHKTPTNECSVLYPGGLRGSTPLPRNLLDTQLHIPHIPQETSTVPATPPQRRERHGYIWFSTPLRYTPFHSKPHIRHKAKASGFPPLRSTHPPADIIKSKKIKKTTRVAPLHFLVKAKPYGFAQ